jgi:thiamine biosynthesis protein ThiS
MVQLTVNGKPVELEQEMALPAFLAMRQVDARHIAVARNGDVIARDAYAGTVLRSGDTIEIVRMVGGG